MSLATAIDTLTAVTVTGVTKSYDLDEMRGSVNPPDLPALLPLPGEGNNDRETFGYATDSFIESHVIRHRLLVKPEQNVPIGDAVPATVDIIDAYHAAIAVLASHSGAIDIRVLRYQAGIVEWGGVNYHGCDFFTEIKVSD